MRQPLLSSLIVIVTLTGCAAAGELAKTVGAGLSDYSSKNTGFIAGAAGVAGSVYTKAGNIVAPPDGGDTQTKVEAKKE